MFSKFDEEAQKVMVEAKREMQTLKHPYVGSEHLMLAILKGNNDLSMIQVARVGVAVENATDELKKVANYITDSNDDDGVAKFLEKLT